MKQPLAFIFVLLAINAFSQNLTGRTYQEVDAYWHKKLPSEFISHMPSNIPGQTCIAISAVDLGYEVSYDFNASKICIASVFWVPAAQVGPIVDNLNANRSLTRNDKGGYWIDNANGLKWTIKNMPGEQIEVECKLVAKVKPLYPEALPGYRPSLLPSILRESY